MKSFSTSAVTIILGLLGTLSPTSILGGSISDSLMQKLSSQGSSDAILEMPSVMSSVLSNPILKMLSGDAKTEMMTSLMKQFTSASQAPFMQAISSMGLASSATPFFISNDIALKNVSLPAVKSLSALPGPFTIREPVEVKVNPLVVESTEDYQQRLNSRAAANTWGVEKISAPQVWQSLGKRGEGIIVANIDTGVNGAHEALKGNYAGRWSDPIYGKKSPTDGNGHGTHTMGTICGTTNGIGVAPKAKWIACRGLDNQGRGSESSLKSCAQWILKQKPNVVSNSWGGGQGSTWFDQVVIAWKNANIVPVFSIGNSGPQCNTANSPGDSEVVWSVGSTDEDDSVSDFSSRGTSINGDLLKPEVSAPGGQVLSAFYRSSRDYATLSGTSMACPHVAGAVALMLSTDKTMTFDEIRNKLETSTIKPEVQNVQDFCNSNDTDSSYPNNSYGNGIINVARALGLED
jgi:subtilisin family serine protease